MTPAVQAGPWWRPFRDLLFPPSCVSCGRVCEGSPLRHVCARCEPLIMRVREPHCETCGHPFFGEVEGEQICPHCEGLMPAYGRAKTATLFKGPARDLVIALKYQTGLYVWEDLRAIVAANAPLCDYLRGGALVPIPLHPRKFRERTYNQSELLAEAIVEALDGEATMDPVLKRVIDTKSQTAYDRASRRRRMKNAFAARKGASITPGKRYVLVDDVFTTGSTLNAAAHALRRAGAQMIDVVTFAHG